MKNKPLASSVDAYIKQFPKDLQYTLTEIRKAIQQSAPAAEELISYGMPAYKLSGPLVYFAAYEKHIGFYPTPSGIIHFAKELKEYATSKGAIQFPIDRKPPLALISKIVKFRVLENKQKEDIKKLKKK